MPNKNNAYSHYKEKLKKHHRKVLKDIKKTYPLALTTLRNNSLVTFGGALMLSSSIGSSVMAFENKNKSSLVVVQDRTNGQITLKHIQDTLLGLQGPLTDETLNSISNDLSQVYGLKFAKSIDSKSLNKNWGYFGQEQHLYRWQGDTLAAHISELDHGIAPNRGAFGYFDNAEQEKYYIATQLHLLPDWNSNWSTLKPFFRYRKVLVYNPANNRSAIAVIGDAGPAEWTGKDFGGSPELMSYLNMFDGRQKSKAVVLLLDDPNYSEVPLGPLNIKNEQNLISSIL